MGKRIHWLSFSSAVVWFDIFSRTVFSTAAETHPASSQCSTAVVFLSKHLITGEEVTVRIRKPLKPEFFSRFHFTTTEVAYVTVCGNYHVLNLLWAVYVYDIFRIFQLPSFIFYEYFKDSHNGQLPTGLIAQLVEQCTGNRCRFMGSNPVQTAMVYHL